MKTKSFQTFLILLISVQLLAQINLSPKQLLLDRAQNVHMHHESAFVAHALTGKTYEINYQAENSQFFEADNPENGTLIYDGIIFSNIEMQYDLYHQQIIVLLESKNGAHYVSIDKSKVSRFSINSNLFVQVRGDSIMKDGIYQHVFSNLYIKRIKQRKETITTSRIEVEFIPKSIFYIKNKNGSFRVTNKKSFFG